MHYHGESVPADTLLSLANLVQVDDKVSSLADCLKRSNAAQISQLCSDWWELTDEEDYCLLKF
jgi:hypothetical protein